jgi:hypothetical protein
MSLLYTVGDIRLLMSLMIYRGKELIATMTATFHAKRMESTKARSMKEEVSID